MSLHVSSGLSESRVNGQDASGYNCLPLYGQPFCVLSVVHACCYKPRSIAEPVDHDTVNHQSHVQLLVRYDQCIRRIEAAIRVQRADKVISDTRRISAAVRRSAKQELRNDSVVPGGTCDYSNKCVLSRNARGTGGYAVHLDMRTHAALVTR